MPPPPGVLGLENGAGVGSAAGTSVGATVGEEIGACDGGCTGASVDTVGLSVASIGSVSVGALVVAGSEAVGACVAGVVVGAGVTGVVVGAGVTGVVVGTGVAGVFVGAGVAEGVDDSAAGQSPSCGSPN